MRKYALPGDVREKMSEYVSNGLVSREFIARIMRSDGNQGIIEAMSCLYGLNIEKKKAIWYHIITQVWKCDAIETCFNELDSMLFRHILENNGVLRRVHLQEVPLFDTDHKISKAVTDLQEMGLIDIHRLNNYDVVYVLSPKYYSEVFGDGEKR